ncbi:unnamed protein product [Microthlaspi erraticum]|uniref:DUF4283 domain-containing protein n=1 Tax=Microthlaspi erraticum TaxID=1685480 RepID=A0A6D2IN89_9BRAS|nr:unnamed protein product [Microthlaspi erraticum]
MSQISAGQRREGSSSHVRRRLAVEEEIIKLPDCDLEAVTEQFKLTVIGRMFHREGRSTDALINLLPKPKIWDVEGRVQGINLGNGRFQFNFDQEEDMMKVLAKRPWHFNRWSFSLEKWEPFTSEDFPNSMPFWIQVTGVPVHFWNNPTFNEIGKALGFVMNIDAKRAKVQVSINADLPLQFERKVGFPNGDTGMVKLTYEGLQRHCFTCKLLSHEESTCPDLTEAQREEKKLQRAEQTRQEALAGLLAIPSFPTNPTAVSVPRPREKHSVNPHADDRPRALLPRREYQERDKSPTIHHSPKRTGDLRHELRERRESRGRDVWRRLERDSSDRNYSAKTRYHPYHKSRDVPRYSRDLQRESQHV